MINTKNLTWLNLSAVDDVPDALSSWLNDDQSLTAKLKQRFENFSVDVLHQDKKNPHAHELELINPKQDCVIREVVLLGNQKAVVFARSVIPMTPDTQYLLTIGSKPLGEVLFNDPNIKRGQLQITHAGSTWGRRSVFSVGSTQLLVSEFFLEQLYAP